jgi:hypothetical protein
MSQSAEAPAPTTLVVANGTDSDITAYFTVGVAADNVTIGQIPFVTAVPGNPNQGTFTVAANSSVQYAPPAGTTLIGNVCFGSPPINCPTKHWPTAVNLFEFSLDLPAGSWETVDISCVAGVNSLMTVALAGGPGWNAGSTEPSVTSFHNKVPGHNTGLVGVYPIGCDICTGSQNPPTCKTPVKHERPQSQPICNVQRNGSGGTVTVTFAGYTAAAE